jgi:xanthosine utilization system XapX-like protein
MKKFGPTRGELVFRLAFSVAGLALLGVALALHGLPEGPALIEVVGLAGVFFGGTVILSLRALLRRDQG